MGIIKIDLVLYLYSEIISFKSQVRQISNHQIPSYHWLQDFLLSLEHLSMIVMYRTSKYIEFCLIHKIFERKYHWSRIKQLTILMSLLIQFHLVEVNSLFKVTNAH